MTREAQGADDQVGYYNWGTITAFALYPDADFEQLRLAATELAS